MREVIDVREAGPGDGALLASLRWRWRVVEAAEEPAVPADRFSRDFAAWMDAHAGSHTAFIAGDGATTLGMAWLAVVERIPGPARWRRLGGLVQSVWVDPAHRNRGAGTALLRAVIERARERGLDYLLVHPTPRSVPFYRRAGFGERGSHLELDLRA